MKTCICEDWKERIKQIENQTVLCKVHGQEYMGPFFKFCPWCGKKLIEQNNQLEDK